MKAALLIGINYFNSPNELSGCINDIECIKKVLLMRGYKYFIVLTDSRDSRNDDYNIPTKDNILSNLSNLVNSLKPEDQLFIQFSGHGTRVFDRNGDETDHQDECICAVDKNILDDELKSILSLAKCKVRAIFDSCHSGTILDIDSSFDNIILLSGCRDAETSVDLGTNGALTKFFIKNLKKNSNISWINMQRKLQQDLKTFGQAPQLSANKNDLLLLPIDI